MNDTRLQCPYCKVRTWMSDYVAFMRDHDRPDGRRCVAASKLLHGGDDTDSQVLGKLGDAMREMARRDWSVRVLDAGEEAGIAFEQPHETAPWYGPLPLAYAEEAENAQFAALALAAEGPS